jgi:hypothetical protein
MMVDELTHRHRAQEDTNAYGPQVIMLGRAGTDCMLRAALWPSEQEAMMKAAAARPSSMTCPTITISPS